MNRNLYPTMDDDDTNNENVSSINPQQEEEEILELEELEIPILPNVPTGQAQSTKTIIKTPASLKF